MMKQRSFLERFLIRWLVCSLGLWIAAGLLGNTNFSVGNSLGVLVMAGFVLAVINTLIRPLIIVLSLPALLLSLGLFLIVINGFMVFLASKIYSQIHVTNFFAAVLAGIIIGLVNLLVSTVLENK